MNPPNSDADVLAQPTRARLFSALQGLKREASTDELAERLGLHVNGVRRHLERLQSAGLVTREKRIRERGRPRDEWSAASGANPGGERPQSYPDLARWLARAMPSGRTRLRALERAGREIGRELAPTPNAHSDSAQVFQQVLASLGFQPAREPAGDDTARWRLCDCPYRESARENPEVICTLHKGITAGLLDELGPEGKLATFEPQDPDVAGCLVEVSDAGWDAL